MKMEKIKLSKELEDKVYDLIEIAKNSGINIHTYEFRGAYPWSFNGRRPYR